MAIDVGSAAINRASNRSSFGILEENPCNADGKITSIEIWLFSTAVVTVGMWYLVSGDTYKCRSAASLGSVASGSKQTKVVDLECKAGDKLGVEMATNNIEAATTGGQGVRWAAVLNRNTVGNELTLAVNLPADTWSVYGIGEEVVAGGGGGPGLLVAHGII